MQKISFEALVARRTQRENAREQTGRIRVPHTDSYLECMRPSEDKMLTYYAGLQAAGDASDILPIVDNALYTCCPALHAKSLHEAIGVQDPLDVVPALFEISERDAMGGELFRWLGLIQTDGKQPENPAKN